MDHTIWFVHQEKEAERWLREEGSPRGMRIEIFNQIDRRSLLSTERLGSHHATIPLSHHTHSNIQPTTIAH